MARPREGSVLECAARPREALAAGGRACGWWKQACENKGNNTYGDGDKERRVRGGERACGGCRVRTQRP